MSRRRRAMAGLLAMSALRDERDARFRKSVAAYERR